MKFISVGIMSAALAAGLGGSALAYHVASGDTPDQRPATVSVAPTRAKAQVVRPNHRFTWAPCATSSRLEKGVCVTDVVRTLAIPVAGVSAPAPAVPAAQAGINSPAPQGGDDDGHEAEAGDDRGSNDHADDDRSDDGDDHAEEDDGNDNGDDDD